MLSQIFTLTWFYYIQETWFNDNITDTELLSNCPYKIYRKDRSCFRNSRSRGDGVCIFVRNHSLEVDLNTNTIVECVATHVQTHDRAIAVLNVYATQININIRLCKTFIK